MEVMTTVLLPVTGEELEAVLRVCETGEEAASEDWVLAEVTLVLLQVQTHSDCLDRDCPHSAPHLEEEQLVKTELIQRWKCRKCPESFLYTAGLEIHERKHDNDNTEMEDEVMIHAYKTMEDTVMSYIEEIQVMYEPEDTITSDDETQLRETENNLPRAVFQNNERENDNGDYTNMEDEALMHTYNSAKGTLVQFREEIMKVEIKLNAKHSVKNKGETGVKNLQTIN